MYVLLVGEQGEKGNTNRPLTFPRKVAGGKQLHPEIKLQSQSGKREQEEKLDAIQKVADWHENCETTSLN